MVAFFFLFINCLNIILTTMRHLINKHYDTTGGLLGQPTNVSSHPKPPVSKEDETMNQTKGKWTTTIGECGATIHINNDYNHPLTFSFSYPFAHIDKELNEEGKANANLIASAPEMLQMLKEINDNDDVYYKIKSVGARARLRKVITKAEGGE